MGIQDANGCRGYRGQRLDDLLLERGISLRARWAGFRFAFDLFRYFRCLTHGNSPLSGPLDGENCQEYFRRIGGAELFERIFWPGLNGPMGGTVEKSSRVILMQVILNLLARGQWNLRDGVERIPEAAAGELRVLTGARVRHAEKSGAEVEGKQKSFRGRAAVFAIPGLLVPEVCPGLPPEVKAVLSRTRYSKMANAAVALLTPPRTPYAGYAFTPDVVSGAEIEMEHLRAPNRCPSGTGMAGVFLWNTPGNCRLETDDESLKRQACEIVERTFPECRGKVLFVHLVRWHIGIAQFPPGRLREMTALRKFLAGWREPWDLTGDYLDGLSSEGALRTGEQAAERLAQKLRSTGVKSPRSC